jgi:uncharacterized DUF497 family protein
MRVIFNPKKATTNLLKHGVRLSDAEPVLYDPFGLTHEDNDTEEEQRLITVGMDARGIILAVVFTYRDEEIRLISARRATATERKKYESGI